jgi:hypothetical protein
LSDGLAFSSLLLIKVIPYALWKQINERRFSGDRRPVNVNVEEGFEKAAIFISGSCFHDTIEPLRSVFSWQSGGGVKYQYRPFRRAVDRRCLSGVVFDTFEKPKQCRGYLVIIRSESGREAVFRWNCVEFLL